MEARKHNLQPPSVALATTHGKGMGAALLQANTLSSRQDTD
jgi:hypothetical protein